MADFEINGIRYKSTKLTPEPATDLLLDIMPVVPEIVDLLISPPPQRADPTVPTKDELKAEGRHRALIVVRVLAAISGMPRDKVHIIIAQCLSTCEREMSGGNGWAKIWSSAAGRSMFDDIGLKQRGEILIHVLQDNFKDFLPGAG